MFPFKTSEEYLSFAKSFHALAALELDRADAMLASGDLASLVERMPGLISMVNCVGYLRGQDGFFLDDRPQPLSEIQKDLQALENAAEARLGKLIGALAASPSADAYLGRLKTYFVDSRSKIAS